MILLGWLFTKGNRKILKSQQSLQNIRLKVYIYIVNSKCRLTISLEVRKWKFDLNLLVLCENIMSSQTPKAWRTSEALKRLAKPISSKSSFDIDLMWFDMISSFGEKECHTFDIFTFQQVFSIARLKKMSGSTEFLVTDYLIDVDCFHYQTAAFCQRKYFSKQQHKK